MAGRTPELNKSVSRYIWPSVIEITLVGTKADTSPACVSMMGSAVSEPVLPFTSPLVNFSTYSALTREARSSKREYKKNTTPKKTTQPNRQRNNNDTRRKTQACLVKSSYTISASSP